MYKWLILTSLAWTVAGAEPAYRWVDDDGQVHYSDRPMPGATRIELISGGAAAARPPAVRAAEPEPAAETEIEPAPVYQEFAIVRPAPQETLWGTGGTVDVSVRIDPTLRPGHRLGYTLDGVLTDLGSASSSFQLQEIYRGMHTLEVVILDSAGQEVLRSSPVSFMMQQTSINFPQNPNNPNRARPGG